MLFSGDFFALVWASFVFFCYISIVIFVIMDLFRDDELDGWYKAIWIIFLVFVPVITGLVYLIARGKGMAARSGRRRSGPSEVDEYQPKASANPAQDIAHAKELLDAGTISQGEFDALKSKALGNQFFGA